MTFPTKETIRKSLKRRVDGWTLFNRLNPDKRLTLAIWNYDSELDQHNMRVKFCDKDYLGEPIPIDSKEDGVEAVYYAHKFSNHRFSNRNMDIYPTYEIRIDALKDKHTASLKIDDQKWTRINPKLARLIIEHPGIKVKHSNREAYISDCKYYDWFALEFDHDYFEEK